MEQTRNGGEVAVSNLVKFEAGPIAQNAWLTWLSGTPVLLKTIA